MIEEAIQLETNVDDMDPRLWPHVIDRLLDAGAQDAWVTPMLMKKGRPAYTLSVLCTSASSAALRAVIFAETTTLGIRETPVIKHVLERREATVSVDAQTIRVKIAFSDGTAVNRSVEWDDVIAAASELGRPAKVVAQEATEKAARIDADELWRTTE